MTAEHPGAPAPLVDANYHARPYPDRFRELSRSGPVRQVLAPGDIPLWVITGHAEGRAALSDERLVKDPFNLPGTAAGLGRTRWPEDVTLVSGRQLLNTDGETHARLRGVLGPHLATRALMDKRPMVTAAVKVLLDRLADEEHIDLVTDFAEPLNTVVIARLLGVAEDACAAAMACCRLLLGPRHPEEPEMRSAYLEMSEALAEFVSVREHEDAGDDDLLSVIVGALRARRIRRREAVSMVGSVLLGASSPPVTLIAVACALALCDQDFRFTVASGSVECAVEEALRYQPPVSFSSWRFAREPLEIAGTRIDRGDAVMVLLAAANRDPRVFAGGDRIVPDRSGPAGHLSFGQGPHYCMGAAVARLQAQVAVPAFLDRFPTARLVRPLEETVWEGVLGDRRPVSVEVALR
ncbi:cytochrome P450 [Actinoallomurus spadix]|uniref:Cytochrome P450 n=1 Tax=Actinoallomurus spadix TaxID=79912 RepID=A0ABN0XEX7_9ACTN|nr:cytochrome P450 [Actinoallomurus spadix]MCO5988872.1 cytochrome P450 [Actinoallomurus spadix]